MAVDTVVCEGSPSSATNLEARPRPVTLILSLPRGGSSWVGDMLSLAEDALYLREPVTQSDPEINRRVVFRPDDFPDLEPDFRRLSDMAFVGSRDFAGDIVRMPWRWDSPGRDSRRLVIKEVNPLACGWFLRRYEPRVILLLRHPAATAWSARKQEWLGPAPAQWAKRGQDMVRAWREASDALTDYPDSVIVSHESLCLDPLGGFARLYEFAGLTWTESVAEDIATWSRDSLKTIGAWRREAPADCVSALREEYLRADLPWYGRKAW